MTRFSDARSEIRLGVNVDHVATLRQARGTTYPDPVEAAVAAERAGAGGITVHLREDRRHIQEHDVTRLLSTVTTKVNLELAAAEEVVMFACRVRPHDCCVVPERREELTTEGGLAVHGHEARLRDVVKRLAEAGIAVSLFIDPAASEIEAAAAVGAPVVELHTGAYADARDAETRERELERLRTGARRASECGLVVNAGHGLTVANVAPIAALPEIVELNIGHSIVARSVMIGMEAAVREMLETCRIARQTSFEARRS
jgi:pyridoxine 5-phosphate synthase